MTRDMDLIRTILKWIEDAPLGEYRQRSMAIEGVDRDELAYHVKLLKDEGYIDAVLLGDDDPAPVDFVVRSLTWKGHDFLDAGARDASLWSKAKATLGPPSAKYGGVLVRHLERNALDRGHRGDLRE